jgi:histidinol-phosphatase (PHP family)
MLYYDLHTHSRFSDGSDMEEMIASATDAGCAGIGISDHCITFHDQFGRRDRYDLIETYERRRERIEAFREEYEIQLFDAVEVSYAPGREAEIASFLEEAEFDYAIGAVHFSGEYDYTSRGSYSALTDDEKRVAVDAYYESLTRLIESELFEVVAHLDLPERVESLRGLSTEDHYRGVAEAFVRSRSIPELNAGRVFGSLGRIHPNPDVLEMFSERGIRFVTGSDSHSPLEVRKRTPYLMELTAERKGLEIVPVSSFSRVGTKTLS